MSSAGTTPISRNEFQVTHSDYAGAAGDRKSTTGGCQFMGRRLISWQCKKKTIVATSSCEAEYVAAASCYGQGRIVGNKMHKAFPLPGESSHWQYKFPLPVKVVPTARRLEMPLSGVCTAIEEMMKKLPVKDRWQLH
nr:putative ribonuclease H-like domain-containing protein [Tanacetum cinerariifolium]